MSVDNSEPQPQGDAIRSALLRAIQVGDLSPVRRVASDFGVTRQAVNRHLTSLINEGWVDASGQTRSRRYHLRPASSNRFELVLDQTLQEDLVWRELVRPVIGEAPVNVVGICQYGLTEIVNNARDHSDGRLLTIEVQRTALEIAIRIADDGIGIFQKIRAAFHFADDQQAVLEFSKGKLTTDRAHHSGEELFFVSRAFDSFEVCSDGLAFRHDTCKQHWQLQPAPDCPQGTQIALVIDLNSPRSLQQAFDDYTATNDDFGFSRTQVPVFLVLYGDENLVSRSQARRLLNRLELFAEILFDFQDVSSIGQGFADEVFWVYQSEHPASILSRTNAAPAIERMVRRAQDGSSR